MSEKREIEQAPCFIEHGCSIVEWPIIDEIEWFGTSGIRQSSIANFPNYVRPIDGFKNHVIWGGSNAHEHYSLNEKLIETLFENLFASFQERFVISTLDLDNPLLIETQKFSFRLASDFLEWAGFVQEFVVFAANSRVLFLRNEELEYALYCRDQSEHPEPFPGVSDADIAIAFNQDRKDFQSPIIDRTRIPHLRSEVIPFCDEKIDSMQA